MTKYYQFVPTQTAHTTLRFINTGAHTLMVKEFDTQVVMIDGDPIEIDALIAEQPVEINLTEIDFNSFYALASKSSQAQFEIGNLETKFKADVQEITGQVAIDEVVSWDKQEQRAREFLLDVTQPAPQLQSLADSRGFGETAEALALKIITNADAYEIAYMSLFGAHHAAKKAVFQF